MTYGTRPTHADERDYSTRSFGAISPAVFPEHFSVDRDIPMQDQNAAGLPYGCTGFTQADNAGNEDRVTYDPLFTYEKTCFMEGHPPTEGCDIRASLESMRIYGLHRLDETDEDLKHRRGSYFQVWNDRGLDWFDGIRAAIYQNKRGVSVGTPWYPNWDAAAKRGDTIMPAGIGDPYTLGWHNYSIVGWKTIKGTQYLIAKPWQGPHYGDRGYVYFPRHTINLVMDIGGTCAFTIARYKPADILTVKLSLLRWATVYIARMLKLKVYN